MGMIIASASESSSNKDTQYVVLRLNQCPYCVIVDLACISLDRGTEVLKKGSQIRFDENQEKENN